MRASKQINVGGRPVGMCASGLTRLYYRHTFHRDVMPLFRGEIPVDDQYDMIQELAFIMAKEYDGADMTKLTEEEYMAWAGEFGALDLLEEKTMTEILSVFQGNLATDADLKKSPDPQPEK